MKKIYLIAALALIAAVSIIVSASKDVTTYATYESASNEKSRVKIAGQIDRDFDIEYNPIESPNAFSFRMKDSDGVSKKVILKIPKPQDFETSETVVVTGKMSDDTFVATDVLMKCPSKYKDEELKIRSEASLSMWYQK